MTDTSHIRYTITAKSTEQGIDTVAISWNGNLHDTVVVQTILPTALDHFVITVITGSLAFTDTTSGKAVGVTGDHTIKIEPRDEHDNPIYSMKFESLIVELLPGAGETLPADTGVGFAANPITNPANILWGDGGNPTTPSLRDTSGGKAYAATSGNFQDEYATITVNSSKSLKNIKAKVTLIDSVGHPVSDSSDALMRWYPMCIDTIEMVTSGVVAEQTQFTMAITPKDIYKNVVEDTSYSVEVTASATGIEGIENKLAVTGASSV
jgi:hypothetical protein